MMNRTTIQLAIAISVSSLALWSVMRDPQPMPIVVVEAPQQTPQQRTEEIENKLRQNPNDGDLWFTLGNDYLMHNEFSNALTCFDYSLRLTSSPSAGQFAAKASALYYLHSQQITPEVQALLNQALVLDSVNETALMLLASDHFISFRYSQAIDLWTKLLDANQIGTKRVLLITRINQAKELQAAMR